jgi:lipopolysaccharide heptosyltransferase I
MSSSRLLIVKLSSLGDLFHALPAVHGLKVGLDAEVDWVVHEEYRELVGCFDDVTRVIPFPRRSFLADFKPFCRMLREKKYDYIVDLQGLLKSAMVVALARGHKRIGPSFHREGSVFFYSAVAGRRDGNRHAVEQALDVVRFLNLPVQEPEFPVSFPVPVVNEMSPRVAIVPVSRWETKNWPPQCFSAVARRLQELRGASIFLLGGASDRNVCRDIECELGGRVVNMAGKLSLAESGGLLAQMDLLLSNDSGPVHMAVATGTPALVVFGPTDPKRTGPYGPKHRVVTALSQPCAPCFSRVCRREGTPCLQGVTPEHVCEIAMGMLPPAS